MKLCVMKLWFSRPGTSWKPPPALPWAPKPSPGWLLNPGSPPAPGNPPAWSFEPWKFALCEHSRLLVRGPGPGNLAFFEVPGLPGRPGALWEVSRAWGWSLEACQAQGILQLGALGPENLDFVNIHVCSRGSGGRNPRVLRGFRVAQAHRLVR